MKGALWDTGMRHGGIFLDLVCQEAFCQACRQPNVLGC